MSKESIDAALNAPHIATAKVFAFESLSTSCRLQGAIGYEVGTKDRLYVRIISSDGPGKFNTCWWSLADIEHTLSKVPEHEAFKAAVLAPAFTGRSVNTMYYVIGALLHCKLLRRAEPVENGYVRNTPAELLQELQALIEAGTDLLPPSMVQGAGPMVVKAAKKSSKKSATPATT
jgi:hypothetical protein